MPGSGCSLCRDLPPPPPIQPAPLHCFSHVRRHLKHSPPQHDKVLKLHNVLCTNTNAHTHANVHSDTHRHAPTRSLTTSAQGMSSAAPCLLPMPEIAGLTAWSFVPFFFPPSWQLQTAQRPRSELSVTTRFKVSMQAQHLAPALLQNQPPPSAYP